MTKKCKKNIAIEGEQIFISESDLAVLEQGRRWGLNSDEVKDEVGDFSSPIKVLLLRPEIESKEIDVDILTHITSSDIIDKFLRTETHRIVAEEGEVEHEITTEAEFSDEEDMVSEELAEVYLAQGLKDMAIETYRKLSLLNPEKSVYFAEIISKIEN